MYKKVVLTLLFFVSVTAVMAQQATTQTMTLSLQDAITYGLQNNVDVKNAIIDERMAQSTVKEVKSQGLPQITGNISITDNTKLPVFIFPNPSTGDKTALRVGNQFQSTAGLEATQLIFDGTFFLGLRAAKDFVNLSTLQVSRSEIQVRADISKAYYLVLITKQNLELLDSNLASLRTTRDEVKATYEAGFAEELDVDRLELSVSQLEIQQRQLQDQYLTAIKVLKLQMGLDMNTDIVLTDDLDMLSGNISSDAALLDSVNVAGRVEYKMVEQQIQLNTLDMRRWRYAYYPRVEAFGAYNNQSFRDSFDYGQNWGPWYNTSYIGVRVNIPVFDGFYKQSKIEQAKLEIEKSTNTKLNLEDAIMLEFFQAKQNYLRALETVNVQKNNVELANKILNTTIAKQKEGLGSSLDVVNAQDAFRQANIGYLSATYELLVAQIELKKATGTLN